MSDRAAMAVMLVAGRSVSGHPVPVTETDWQPYLDSAGTLLLLEKKTRDAFEKKLYPEAPLLAGIGAMAPMVETPEAPKPSAPKPEAPAVAPKPKK